MQFCHSVRDEIERWHRLEPDEIPAAPIDKAAEIPMKTENTVLLHKGPVVFGNMENTARCNLLNWDAKEYPIWYEPGAPRNIPIKFNDVIVPALIILPHAKNMPSDHELKHDDVIHLHRAPSSSLYQLLDVLSYPHPEHEKVETRLHSPYYPGRQDPGNQSKRVFVFIGDSGALSIVATGIASRAKQCSFSIPTRTD
ncbi:hypothetical protein BC938DRAFT_482854 [Jimgerdemannia flammicorona]|uniref:Uncharacterized protein n=1 Tax=Jimgerdemannia flammicorona TaxID=994334 RepID=A0A433QD31_9FUNG|nr:hypothetical protein BC938DRAFT_482854 [Jimgerdemannia flammicorona]